VGATPTDTTRTLRCKRQASHEEGSCDLCERSGMPGGAAGGGPRTAGVEVAAMVGAGPDSDAELRARGDRSRTAGLVLVLLPVARPRRSVRCARHDMCHAPCMAACTDLAAHGVTAHITSVVSGDPESWQVQACSLPPC